MMKLSDYAKSKNISYRTAYNHFKKGMIPEAYQIDNRTIYIRDSYIERGDDIWINLTQILADRGYVISKEGSQ